MTTDNRTNEPTEAQVEAAAQAIYNHSETTDDGMICTGGPDEGMQCDTYMGGDQAMHQARAALTAAGVVPVDEHDRAMQIAQAIARAHTFTTPTALSIAEVAMKLAAPVDEETALRFCTCSHWLEAHLARKCLEHHCACENFEPVLCRRPANEEGIAEVLRLHELDEPTGGTASVAWRKCSCGKMNAVSGGTRTGAAAKARQHVARAVREYLERQRGEGR